MYNYRGKLDRCVDGDTLDIHVDLGFKIFVHHRFRLLHVNTPERGRKNYKKATELLEELCKEESKNDGYIYFKSHKTGKYGRWLFWNDRINMTMMLNYPYEKRFQAPMKKIRDLFTEKTDKELTSKELGIEYEHGRLEDFLWADDEYNFKVIV